MEKSDNIMFRIDHLNLRRNQLEAKKKSLSIDMEKSNKVFESLWNGCQMLEILKPNHSQLITISRDDFKKELRILERNYNISVDKLSKSEIEEEFVADLLILLTSRWNTIQELKKRWRTRNVQFLSAHNEIAKQLQPSDSVIEKEKIYNSIIENLAKREKLIMEEEEGTDEQYYIYETRKALLSIASEIFKESGK